MWWYNEEHLLSAIRRYVTPGQRHRGEDSMLLAKRQRIYQLAQQKTPNRWSGNSRNWQPVEEVWLNCQKVSEINPLPLLQIA